MTNEEKAAYAREYRAKNRDRLNSYRRKWYKRRKKKDPEGAARAAERARENTRKYKARKAAEREAMIVRIAELEDKLNSNDA